LLTNCRLAQATPLADHARTVAHDRISGIEVIADPEHLRRLSLCVLG